VIADPILLSSNKFLHDDYFTITAIFNPFLYVVSLIVAEALDFLVSKIDRAILPRLVLLHISVVSMSILF